MNALASSFGRLNVADAFLRRGRQGDGQGMSEDMRSHMTVRRPVLPARQERPAAQHTSPGTGRPSRRAQPDRKQQRQVTRVAKAHTSDPTKKFRTSQGAPAFNMGSGGQQLGNFGGGMASSPYEDRSQPPSSQPLGNSMAPPSANSMNSSCRQAFGGVGGDSTVGDSRVDPEEKLRAAEAQNADLNKQMNEHGLQFLEEISRLEGQVEELTTEKKKLLEEREGMATDLLHQAASHEEELATKSQIWEEQKQTSQNEIDMRNAEIHSLEHRVRKAALDVEASEVSKSEAVSRAQQLQIRAEELEQRLSEVLWASRTDSQQAKGRRLEETGGQERPRKVCKTCHQ